MKTFIPFLRALLLVSALTMCGTAVASNQVKLANALAAINAGDLDRGIKLLRPLAKRGNAEAQAHLWSVLKTTDEKQANMWLMRAAGNGHADSLHVVGLMYLHGNGVAEDPQQALKYLKLAAAAGIPAAQSHLAVLYRTGPNSVQNDKEAFKWFKIAADGGDVEAQFRLAEMYRYGYGVNADSMEMKTWLQRAARQGHQGAAQALREISAQ